MPQNEECQEQPLSSEKERVEADGSPPPEDKVEKHRELEQPSPAEDGEDVVVSPQVQEPAEESDFLMESLTAKKKEKVFHFMPIVDLD
mmetsp:Transcript_32969/g.50434  ORF Transcript_32969/g.50434 Transcript_32969/m.50434 type:complete len:88 (-) Transcript_32969:3-266(-)